MMTTNGDANGPSRRTRFLNVLFSGMVAGFSLFMIVLLPLCFIVQTKATAFFGRYVARLGIRGNPPGYLTSENVNLLFRHLPIAVGIFGICAITLALNRRRLVRFLADVPSEWTGIRSCIRGQFPCGLETGLEVCAVFAVLLIGVFLRIRLLGRAIRYDEAWTYVEFASKPLVVGLSNYRAPNNQLLNTLLVHFSTRLFGNTIYALRLPSLVAGSLAIVASWFVARGLYGRLAAVLTAGCIAALPTFIEFSINARGYALQWLFILAAVWFAVKLHANPSLKSGWLGLTLAAVAGAYCIPTTLLAIAGVFGWMLVSAHRRGEHGGLRTVSRGLGFTGVAIAMLLALLYLPVLLVRGPGAVVTNESVASQQGEFVEGLRQMVQCAWTYWTEGVPSGVLWVLFAGLVVGLWFHRRICSYRVSVTLVFVLSAGAFVFAFRVFGFPRTWSYILLFACMTASAGLSLVLRFLGGRSPIRQVVLAGLAAIGLASISGSAVVRQRALFTTNETGTIIDADQIVDYLSAELRPGDALVSNAIIEYELLRRQPRLYNSLADTREAAHILAVAYKATGKVETCRAEALVPLLAAEDTADPNTLSRQIDLAAYSKPVVLAKFLTSTVFSLDRKKKEPCKAARLPAARVRSAQRSIRCAAVLHAAIRGRLGDIATI